MAGAAEEAAAGYREASARVAALTDAIRDEASTAAVEGQQAGAAANGIRDTARSQAGAITPATHSPEGLALLVSTMDDRLAAMQNHLESTRERMRASAARIGQHSVELAAVVAGRG